MVKWKQILCLGLLVAGLGGMSSCTPSATPEPSPSPGPDPSPEPTTVAVTGVTLDKPSISIVEGQSDQLKATVAPANATNKKVSWDSSDKSIATVSDGVVTAVKAGTATVTVTTQDGGFKATCQVTVTAKSVDPGTIAVTGVSLDKTTLSLEEGATDQLTATVSPADATNKDVMWSSSDEGVATVKDGLVTAIKAGTATITVTTQDGSFTATCQVTVTAKESEEGGDSEDVSFEKW